MIMDLSYLLERVTIEDRFSPQRQHLQELKMPKSRQHQLCLRRERRGIRV